MIRIEDRRPTGRHPWQGRYHRRNSMFTSSARFGLALGTALQLAMVGTGHVVVAIAQLFGPLGVLISLLAGLVYAARSGRGVLVERLLVGALVGGFCALIGIVVSW